MDNWAWAKQGMGQTGHGPNRAWAKQGMGQTGHWASCPLAKSKGGHWALGI